MTAPIGSIVAYGGRIDAAWETASGWMVCDGRLLDRSDPAYTPLFDAIGFFWGGDLRDRFNLPDLRGYFLRGVDGPRKDGRDERRDRAHDPDRDSRGENNPNGNTGNTVGSVQEWGTALPGGEHAFTLTEAGRHHHILDFELDATRDVDGVDNTVAYPALPNTPEHTTDSSGLHVHVLGGGHAETRPVNAYVNWIIRFR
jgi:hypothetical protein